MALRILVTLLAFVAARSDDIEAAMAADDTCAAGGDCSLELNQLRGIKVHYLDALEDDEEDEEVQVRQSSVVAWKDCMQKKGYSAGCASCMAQLVGCSRDHCMNQCITNDKAPACTHCVKASCRHKMKACSGLNAGGH
ncbi:unnamed protein product [Symbiodinium necroappetens]|uniref:Uncharacterized protein n=1 Tax=Symbiodinium necroappetens TaxID=1628268 RepID=A0A813A2Q8_9DINO|nr:unnamed protein product [Symbiodinium necroappetens]